MVAHLVTCSQMGLLLPFAFSPPGKATNMSSSPGFPSKPTRENKTWLGQNKNWCPKWNPAKWKQGLNVDPYHPIPTYSFTQMEGFDLDPSLSLGSNSSASLASGTSMPASRVRAPGSASPRPALLKMLAQASMPGTGDAAPPKKNTFQPRTAPFPARSASFWIEAALDRGAGVV